MPFDNTPVETAPDLTRPSLEGLSWLLRHREAWPEGHVWDYSCGESCALGIGRKQWPDFVRRESITPGGDMTRTLGVDMYTGSRMFSLRAYQPVGDLDVTPEMVADRIDQYIATGSNKHLT